MKENEALLLRFKYYSFFDLNPKVYSYVNYSMVRIFSACTGVSDLAAYCDHCRIFSLLGNCSLIRHKKQDKGQ